MARNARARTLGASLGRWQSTSLLLEDLEQRQLLSAAPLGAEITVTDAVNTVISPKVGVDALGNFVVVWQGTDASGTGIFARRFAEDGTPLGDAFGVNTFTTGDQTNPRLDMNDSGQFVIAWESATQDGSGLGVFARVFDATGNALGNDFQVNTTTAGDQKNIALDMNDAGAIVIGWSSANVIQAQRLDATGTPVGGELTGTAGGAAAVGIDGAGNFILGGNVSGDILMQRFAADGTTIGSALTADFTSTNTAVGRIVMNDAGEWWTIAQGGYIDGRHYNAAGIEQGSIHRLGEFRSSFIPSFDFGVAISEVGGLLVSYATSALFFSSTTTTLTLNQFNPDGSLESVYEKPATFTVVKSSTDVTINSAGRVLAVSASGLSANLFLAQRLQEATLRVSGLSSSTGEELRPGIPAMAEIHGLLARLSLPASTTGGATGANSVLNPANWQLLRGLDDVSNLITGISYTNGRVSLDLSQTLPPGNYTLVAKDSIHDTAGAALDGGEDDLPGGDALVEFKVSNLTPAGPQWDSGYPSNDGRIAVATNAAGQSVVIWNRSSDRAVTAQLYAADGTPSGAPIVFEDTPVRLTVVMHDDGGFSVAWGSVFQAFVRRYDATGTVVSNLALPLDDILDRFAFSPDGRFAVVAGQYLYLFYADGSLQRRFEGIGGNGLSFDPTGNLLVARIFGDMLPNGDYPALTVLPIDSDANPQEQIVVVDQEPHPGGSAPVALANPDGGIVVLYMRDRSTSDRTGVNYFARFYDSQGEPSGPEIQVSSPSEHDLDSRSLTATNPGPPITGAFDGQGHLVVAWQSNYADRYDQGIFARAFLTDGTPLGAPQRVNVNPFRNQAAQVVSAGGGNIYIGLIGPNSSFQRFTLLEPPTLDLSDALPDVDYSQTIVPNGNPFAIVDPTGLTTHTNNALTLQSATVQIAGALPGDVLSVDTTGTSIVASYANGKLTLIGEDTPANYQQVLRTAKLSTTAARPNGSMFDITFVVNDGVSDSPIATTHITNYVPGSVAVAGRYTFYRNSSLTSGNNVRTGIATDKQAYLPGSGPASFQNVTSYSRGINGIIIDLAGDHGTLSLDDFQFRVGTSNSPNTWFAAPKPVSLTVRAGSGISGSDSVEIQWNDNSMRNTWLEVTVKANVDTGLAAPDVFYFGNRVGETGSDTPIAAVTNLTDETAIRNNAGLGVAITNVYDIDRNGSVQMADAMLARTNTGFLRYLNIGTVAATATALADVLADSANDFVGPLASPAALEEIARALTAPKFQTPGQGPTIQASTLQPLAADAQSAAEPIGPHAVRSESNVFGAWERVDQYLAGLTDLEGEADDESAFGSLSVVSLLAGLKR